MISEISTKVATSKESESRAVTGWKYFCFVAKYAIIGKFHCDLPFKTKQTFHIFRYLILGGLFFSVVFTLSELNLAWMKTLNLLDFTGNPYGVSELVWGIVDWVFELFD